VLKKAENPSQCQAQKKEAETESAEDGARGRRTDHLRASRARRRVEGHDLERGEGSPRPAGYDVAQDRLRPRQGPERAAGGGGKTSPKSTSRSSLEPSLFYGLEEERREAIYQPWLDLVNRYAARWEARIDAGDFDLGRLDEFDRVTDDLLETLSPLGLQEKREQPPDYPYTYGPIVGEALGRILGLFNPMLAAAAQKYPQEVLGDELEALRRKHDELEPLHDELEPLRRKRDEERRALERGA
jgi:hypothetical protein